MRRLESKDKFCEAPVAWKQNHFLYAQEKIVHRGDVTLPQYSSGHNLKDTWMFYYFTVMCKRLQDGPMLLEVGTQFDEKVRCVKAKTKPQYQSEKNRLKKK